MFPLVRTLFGIVVGGLGVRLAAVLARFQVGHSTRPRSITRRGFVRNAALGAVLVVLAQLGVGFVRFFWPNKTGAFGGRIAVEAANVPPVGGTPYRNAAGRFYLVHTEDGLLALWWKCPHLGCTVPWNENEQHFHCPCHGSIYLYNGVRIAGPAPRPMDLMALEVDPTGEVIVDTGKIIERTDYHPEQAVPYPA